MVGGLCMVGGGSSGRGVVTFYVNGATRTVAQGVGMELIFMEHLRNTSYLIISFHLHNKSRRYHFIPISQRRNLSIELGTIPCISCQSSHFAAQ